MRDRPPIVLCPLEFEARTLRRMLPATWSVTTCGPGATAVAAWAERHGVSDRLVALAGLAGGLRPDGLPAGSAIVIREVLDESGRWTPPLDGRDVPEIARGRVAASVALLRTSREKAELHRRTGADLVDMESGAFARWAERLGWPWMIVRGVRDDAHQGLPRGMESWVGPDGRTMVSKALAAMLRHPRTIPAVCRLQRASRAALGAAAELLERVVETSLATAPGGRRGPDPAG